MNAPRVFVTGGSGFIGTNLLQYFLDRGCSVENFDTMPPRNVLQRDYWTMGDCRDVAALASSVEKFKPDFILHAAARTDLNGAVPEDYSANVAGVESMIATAKKSPSIKRIVFFSSMLVCEIGYTPRHETDYRPTTCYGMSKVIGERLLRHESTKELPWVLVRPTSIWGPWFGAPYRNFFEAVRKGWFVLPRGKKILRSYGYVGNLVAQTAAILTADPDTVLGKTFYLGDYDPLDLRRWAQEICKACGRKNVHEVPLPLLRLGALCGDFGKRAGWSNPPLTSFRLNNLLTSAVFDMSAVQRLCPSLPISVEQGVRLTMDWLQEPAQSAIESLA